IRPIPYGIETINEAKKHGFKKIIVTQANVSKSFKTADIEIIGITNFIQIKDLITG
ncbi:DNA repair protein RadA, partial [Francisella tularensis subsp. holarctica]|nr:DNA repair protein RadA [Francisella tularensis subsp. holarctica]